MEKETIVTETVTEPVIETTEPVVETTAPEATGDDITLEDLLSELIPEVTVPPTTVVETVKEEIPDGPVFNDDNDTITEKELEDLENEVGAVVEELEAEIATAEKAKEELSSQVDLLNSQLSDEQKNNEEISTALKKIIDHPSLGKLAKDLLEGKEVDIPKILEDKINEDIASMADITTQAPISIEPKKLSLGQRLGSMRTL